MIRSIVVCLLAAAASVRAQEGPIGAMFAGPGENTRNAARARVEYAPGSSGAPTISDVGLEASVLVSSSAGGTWTARERAGHFGLNGAVAIPDGGGEVPRSLWSQEAGVRYAGRLDSGRSWGAGGTIGSASDRLFNSIHETTVQGIADFRVPSGERNAWLFSLSYSNTRYFLPNLPLPGVAYQFQSGSVRGVVGFPFVAVFWTPAPLWEARLSAFGPRRINADLGRRLAGPFRIHGGFDWGGQSWLPVRRPIRNEPLTFERKRLFVGLESPLGGGLTIDAVGGRQFDQYFYESRSFASPSSRASLPPGWYLSASLLWRFDARSAGLGPSNFRHQIITTPK
jgi:hypothetical protein